MLDQKEITDTILYFSYVCQFVYDSSKLRGSNFKKQCICSSQLNNHSAIQLDMNSVRLDMKRVCKVLVANLRCHQEENPQNK